MTAMSKIREYIAALPENSTVSSKELRGLASSDNIRQILNRLVVSGELIRLSRGIFMKQSANENSYVNISLLKIIKAQLEKTGETVDVDGADAARRLGLSTQVPMQEVYCTDGNTRQLKIGNRTVKLKHINPSSFIAPGTTAGMVISALRYLGKENVDQKTISQIEKKISSQDFLQVLRLVGQLPDWMADVFYKYTQEG